MNYIVRTADKTGKIDLISMEGSSPEEITELLGGQNLYPLGIEKAPSEFGGFLSAESIRRMGFGMSKLKHLIEFSKLLALLIKAGMSVNEAFGVLAEKNAGGDYLGGIISDVKNFITVGLPLSASLSRRPDFFDELYVKSVASGESSGNLSRVLYNLAEYYRKKQELYRKLVSAATYPMVIVVLSTCGVIYLFTKIVPTYKSFFSDMNAQLPQISQIVFSLADFLSSYFVAIALLVFAFAAIVVRWLRTPHARECVDSLELIVPVYSQLTVKKFNSIFYRTAGLLIGSGLNVVNAIEVASNVITNGILLRRLRRSIEMIKAGNPIGRSFEESGFAADVVPRLIKTGEESGSLEEIFTHIADDMDEGLDALTNTIESIFGPLILVFVLLVFGVIILAILLPMISAASLIQ